MSDSARTKKEKPKGPAVQMPDVPQASADYEAQLSDDQQIRYKKIFEDAKKMSESPMPEITVVSSDDEEEEEEVKEVKRGPFPKPFIPPGQEKPRKKLDRGLDWLEKHTRAFNLGDPLPVDMPEPPTPKLMDMDTRNLSRKEREYLAQGKSLEPPLVVFGPSFFTNHGHSYKGNGNLLELEDGSVVDGWDGKDTAAFQKDRDRTPKEMYYENRRKEFAKYDISLY